MIWGLPALFSVSAQAGIFMQQGLIIYAFSYPFKAGIKFICAYHYSNKRAWQANLLIYLDPLLTPLLLMFLPQLFGMNGIWLALPLTQTFVFVTGIFLTTVFSGIDGRKSKEEKTSRSNPKNKKEGQEND